MKFGGWGGGVAIEKNLTGWREKTRGKESPRWPEVEEYWLDEH